jgi:hypothetical protein
MSHLPQAAAGPAADDGWRRRLVGAGLALVPAALVGWTGWWVLAVSVVVLLTLLFGRGRCVVRKRWDVVATATALLAGIVGVSGAGLAITTMGSLPPYDSRVALGWTALALAAAATVLGLSSPARAAVSGLAMALAGLMGAVAISFFYINTYYFAAVPIWVLAAVFRLIVQDRGSRRV